MLNTPMGQKWSNTYKMFSLKVLGVIYSGFCFFYFYHFFMVLGGGGCRYPFNNYVACFEWVLTSGTCCMFFSSFSLNVF